MTDRSISFVPHFYVMRYCLLTLFVFLTNSVVQAADYIHLTDTSKAIYVVRAYVEFYEDSSNSKKPDQLFSYQGFQRVKDDVDDLINENQSHTYWLRFSVIYHSEQLYRLEMYDHDIDQVGLYYQGKNGMIEMHTGYDNKFTTRDLYHKNPGFLITGNPGDTIMYLMKFKSHNSNVLEPVIRTIPEFYQYSVLEYTLLGFFYGFTCVIIIYNLVHFLILRKIRHLYYLFYMFSITVFLMSRNGTGFQFLWPEYPGANYFIEILSGVIGITCFLLFAKSYFKVKKISKTLSLLLYILIGINIVSVFWQLFSRFYVENQIFSIILIQITFAISLFCYRRNNAINIWFIVGFAILNIGFVVSWLEHINVISSSIFTVYILYFCVNLQFITTSISLTLNIKKLGDDKNKALIQLLETADKNQTMRILALKKQMSPHFIFNALNSILQRILADNKEDAAEHLIKFSKIIRKNLEQSDALFARVIDEIEILKLYMSLEAMRLGNSFTYSVDIEPAIDAESEFIPSFIIQPFVENSIWHGLMPKQGFKHISVSISKTDTTLNIVVEDNGIGRKQAAKHGKLHNSDSQGINLIAERLKLINKKFQIDSGMEIQDLYDAENKPSGTRVTLKSTITYEQSHTNYYS
jgi:sensor histidine kinase YesM